MQTFNDFIAQRKITPVLENAATMLAERTENPVVYLIEWTEGKPYEAAFLEKIQQHEELLAEAGVLGRLGQIAGDVGKGIKGFFGSQMNKAKDTWSGPMQKFEAAQMALNALAQSISSNQELAAALPGLDGQPGSLVSELQQLVQQMEPIKPKIPQLIQHQASNQAITGAQPGGVNLSPDQPELSGAAAAGAPARSA